MPSPSHPCKRVRNEPGTYEYRGRTIRRNDGTPQGYFGRFEASVTVHTGREGRNSRLRMCGTDSLAAAKAMIDADLDGPARGQ